MKNSRLITLILSLSNKETREIRSFLTASFFNKRPEVNQLFNILINNLKSKNPEFDKTLIYQDIVKNASPYDDQQMRLWMSFLLKAIEKYLIHHSVFEDQIFTKTRLVEIYRKRNLNKMVEVNLKELEIAQNKAKHRNAFYYQNDFQIQLEHYLFTTANRRMSELNLQKMSDNLDVAYCSQKLRQACLAISHQAVYNIQYNIGLLQELILYVEQKELFQIPAIAVYYYAFLTLSKPNEGHHFQFFKEAIVNYREKFPREELRDLYILAINFCIKKYNEGDRQLLEDEFEIYQEGFKQNLFITNKSLSRFTYRNVVTVGLILEAYEWVENFIIEYKTYLQKNYRESMFSFCLARLEYSRKNYDAALGLLQKSPYKDLLLNLAAKTVMLKIFYELEEFDLLDAHLEAMRTFIKRKKIIGYHQENYLNLIYFTKKLMERNPFDRSESKTLYTEIKAIKAVAEKEWLLLNVKQ